MAHRSRLLTLAPIAVLTALPACRANGVQIYRASAAPAASAKPDPERLAADVAWLAADAREGRRAGTEPARACAEWIAARLDALGLQPAGSFDGMQSFTVPIEPR